jgi:hypothetical protein
MPLLAPSNLREDLCDLCVVLRDLCVHSNPNLDPLRHAEQLRQGASPPGPTTPGSEEPKEQPTRGDTVPPPADQGVGGVGEDHHPGIGSET